MTMAGRVRTAQHHQIRSTRTHQQQSPTGRRPQPRWSAVAQTMHVLPRQWMLSVTQRQRKMTVIMRPMAERLTSLSSNQARCTRVPALSQKLHTCDKSAQPPAVHASATSSPIAKCCMVSNDNSGCVPSVIPAALQESSTSASSPLSAGQDQRQRGLLMMQERQATRHRLPATTRGRPSNSRQQSLDRSRAHLRPPPALGSPTLNSLS